MAGNEGACLPVLPVELIVDISDRTPSIPEIRIRIQCGAQLLRSFINPSVMDRAQGGAEWRRDARYRRTNGPFGREAIAWHDCLPRLKSAIE
jgi:hypothetical protein